MPVSTWDRHRISHLLSDICPHDEDQIDKTVPSPILSYLAENCYRPNDGFDGLVTTFDEGDAIQRLQAQQEAEHFPWKDESEWQAALGNPRVAKAYLDVTYETIQRRRLKSESEIIENAHLPDAACRAQPLKGMFSAVNLPPNLAQRGYVPIVHPELQDHRLLKKRAWKLEPFTLDDYLDNVCLETASLSDRKSFSTWLSNNWRIVRRRQTLIRIADLPVWPSSNGSLLPLNSLCEPRNARVASIMCDALDRPSTELLRTGLVRRTGRGRLALRNSPSLQELERFLSERIHGFSREIQLTPTEQREFHRLEKDLAVLATSTPRLKEYLRELAEKCCVALDKVGNLRDPGDLVRDKGVLQRLHLLDEHLIDRSNGILDRIDGWGPRTVPTTDQLVDTLREDASRLDAHVPRIQEYVRQSRRESIEAIGLFEIPCIPVEGELRSPSQIALRGRLDFWGDWKIHAPVTDINPETQRWYTRIGVVGGTPNATSSMTVLSVVSNSGREGHR